MIVLMYFSEPAADGPTVSVPGAFTTAAITLGVLITLLLGIVPTLALDWAAGGGFVELTVRKLTGEQRRRSRGSRSATRELAGGDCRRTWTRVEALLHRDGAQRLPVRHRDLAAPDRRRRQAVPAAVHPARRADRAAAGRRRGDHRGGRRRADPPGHALPRRRDGLGHHAPRRAERQLAVGQHGRDPHRRLPVRPRLPAGRRPRPGRGADHRRDVRRAGHRPDARDPRPARRARTRCSTT